MTLDTTATEAAILARLRTILPRFYDTKLPDNETPRYPYGIVLFGEPQRTGTDRHVSGTRNDVQVGYVTVRVISTDVDSAKAIKNAVRDSLTGYRPPDSGEMGLEGGFGTSSASTETRPTLFIRDTSFSYKTNLNWNT